MLISPVLGRECPPNEIDDALQKRLQSIVIATAGDPAGRSSKLRSEGKLGIVLADYIENFKTFKNLGDSYIRILKEKDNIEDHAVTLFLSTLLFLPVDWVEKKSVGELYERLAEIERKYCIYEESDPFINAIHYRYKTYVTAHKCRAVQR